jgi:hypothetical protein
VTAGGIEEEVVGEDMLDAHSPHCSVSVEVGPGEMRLVEGVPQRPGHAIVEGDRFGWLFAEEVVVVTVAHFDAKGAWHSMVSFLLPLVPRQLWEGPVVVSADLEVYLSEMVDFETFAILPAEGALVEGLAVQVSAALAASISPAVLSRIPPVGQRGNRIWTTCPSTFPTERDMGGIPSRHH